ncbi:hypothetical protein K7432_000595 [Basidiobolus ranarum]|uniref:Uncharacterized protein n=1 Tax=Basidiobolus ranarum TaxID=34480 RepID=A0ABR2X4C0_9FUNG
MFSSISIAVALAFTLSTSQAFPTTNISDPSYGPIPGESSSYNSYNGRAPPFPGNHTAPILSTSQGNPGPDDLLFQNLLSAEWAIFSFYQQGVEVFTAANFTEWPNTTYSRIQEIRNNEAGHLRIFQNQISSNSVKPGACKYNYGFTSAASFLALSTIIEISSMAFLTGLILQAQTNTTKAVLVAIAETESRHETWGLIDIWKADPFGGPSDTVFPYANQVLDVTNEFIVPGSCPKENPTYPEPSQHLPQLSYVSNSTLLAPELPITFSYRNPSLVPNFQEGKDYYAVFFHGLLNISMPFDTKTNSSMIPKDFENKGVILAVISDVSGAPTEASVLAGPLIILLQPAELAKLIY